MSRNGVKSGKGGMCGEASQPDRWTVKRTENNRTIIHQQASTRALLSYGPHPVQIEKGPSAQTCAPAPEVKEGQGRTFSIADPCLAALLLAQRVFADLCG